MVPRTGPSMVPPKGRHCDRPLLVPSVSAPQRPLAAMACRTPPGPGTGGGTFNEEAVCEFGRV